MTTELGAIDKKRLAKMIDLLLALIAAIKKLKPKLIVLHHTATSRSFTSFVAIDRGHKNRGYPKSNLGYYCAYNYLVIGDGTVHQARTDLEQGQGASTCRERHLDICLTGNFQTDYLSEEQNKALTNLLDDLKMKYGINDIKLHKDFYNTLCPGTNLISWLKNYQNATRGHGA